MRKTKYFFLLFIITAISVINVLPSFAINSPSSNYEIIDSLIQYYADSFSKSQILKKGGIIRFNITNHPAKWLLKDKLIRILSNDSCIISDDTSNSISHKYEFNINNISVKYLNKPSNPDSIEREIFIHITGFKSIDNRIEPLNEFKNKFTDIISKDKIDSVNSKQYDFASSSLPIQDKTFFEDVLQPVILITATVVAVVLLFTVRSN